MSSDQTFWNRGRHSGLPNIVPFPVSKEKRRRSEKVQDCCGDVGDFGCSLLKRDRRWWRIVWVYCLWRTTWRCIDWREAVLSLYFRVVGIWTSDGQKGYEDRDSVALWRRVWSTEWSPERRMVFGCVFIVALVNYVSTVHSEEWWSFVNRSRLSLNPSLRMSTKIFVIIIISACSWERSSEMSFVPGNPLTLEVLRLKCVYARPPYLKLFRGRQRTLQHGSITRLPQFGTVVGGVLQRSWQRRPAGVPW